MNYELISHIARSQVVAKLIAREHIDNSVGSVVVGACASLRDIESAPARALCYFASAVASAHYLNRARYSVALRKSA